MPTSEKTGQAIGRSVVALLATILLWQTMRSCSVFPPGEPGFFYLIWKAGIILPLHEAGHFISSPFGYAITVFGGSFWQVAFPLLLVIVALRQESFFYTIYLTLTGVHLTDVTPYIFDAPFRSLPLITGRKDSHDWGNLLNHFQAMRHAEMLADLAFYGGILIALAGTGLSVHLIIRDVRSNEAPIPLKSSLAKRLLRRRTQ
jgi:hypothetical protein